MLFVKVLCEKYCSLQAETWQRNNNSSDGRFLLMTNIGPFVCFHGNMDD